MPLSIIIVNYRAALHVCKSIQSAMQFPSAKNFEWIVVDNYSQDNSQFIITEQFPFVQWINMDYNAGFARANNAGILHAKNETVLLLNPDTLILDDAIKKCYERFIMSNYIAASVQLLNEDRTPQITGNYFMKGGLNHLLPLPYLGALLRKIAFAFHVKKTNVPEATIEQKVDWINGAFMMVKKSVIERSGMLDEDFFLYAEEIEWCSRFKKVGNIVVYGDLHTIHLQGESINQATNTKDKGYFNLFDHKGLQLIVSQQVRIRKQFGAGWFLFHLIMYTIEIPIYSLCNLFDSLFHKVNPMKESYKIEGFANNVFKLWSLTPSILRKRPRFYKML